MQTRPCSNRYLFGFIGWGFTYVLCFSWVNPPVYAEVFPRFRGDVYAHDPSTVIRCQDRYYVFYTGNRIPMKSSDDRVTWRSAGRVFNSPPAWTTSEVPGFHGGFWAPDIIYAGGRYCLYYACSSWGSQVSAIGLATNPTLGSSDPNYHWTDQGMVIQSQLGSPYNCIDPSVLLTNSGQLWMSFGSYWNGIYLVQLDPQTGKRISSNSPVTRLADHSSIEAPCLVQHDDWYYLFVDWGSCCQGVDSTYNIRVGRSQTITGPYRDRSGTNMVANGGDLFLAGTGNKIGPGHMSVLHDSDGDFFGYHYYDADLGGNAIQGMQPLSWSADEWPVAHDDWSANYRFTADARDDRGRYHGLLQGGAKIVADANMGSALDLSADQAYVQLPAGVGFAHTFVAVVKLNDTREGQCIFSFGQDTNREITLKPSVPVGWGIMARLDIRAGGSPQSLIAPVPIEPNTWTQLAVTLDGDQGSFYVDGNLVDQEDISLVPLTVKPLNNYLGRYYSEASGFLDGEIAAFRAYGRVLTPEEIVAPVPYISHPGAGTTYTPGMDLHISGGADDFMGHPLSARALDWQIQWHYQDQVEVIMESAGAADANVVLPESTGFYRVLLNATDDANRIGQYSVDLYPASANTPAPWTALYTFNHDAQDDLGPWDGALEQGATTVNASARGNDFVLQLDGINDYVSLPSGVGNWRSFGAWIYWRGGGSWQRILDVGSDTSNYAFLSPADNTSRPRFEMSVSRAGNRCNVEGTEALPTDEWVHVALVLEGTQAVMYINGQAVAVTTSANLLPVDTHATGAFLGRSLFNADPYFNGRLDSVLISSKVLGIDEIMGLCEPESQLHPLPHFLSTTLFSRAQLGRQITTALAPSRLDDH